MKIENENTKRDTFGGVKMNLKVLGQELTPEQYQELNMFAQSIGVDIWNGMRNEDKLKVISEIKMV